MAKVQFGYWAIRGLGQVSRLLLSYTEADFEEVQYTFETKEKWGEDKKNLGLDFPNLPYLIDGDAKITESSAIQQYIINRSDKKELLGKDLKDQVVVQQLLGVLGDAFKEIRSLAFNKEYATVKTEKLEKVRAKFEYLKKFVGEKNTAIGYLTLVDFILADHADYFQTLYPTELPRYSFLAKIRANVESLAGVVNYYKRPNAVTVHLPPQFAALEVKRNVVLGYFPARGLAQVIRHMLAYYKVDFVEKLYQSFDEYKADKPELEKVCDFPNTPYLIDGACVLTESDAICFYILKKWGKCSPDAKEQAVHDMLAGVYKDVNSELSKTIYDKATHQVTKKTSLEAMTPKLEYLQKFYGERSTACKQVCTVDFLIAELSQKIANVYPEEEKAWPFLAKVRVHVEGLPEVKAYYDRPDAVKDFPKGYMAIDMVPK